MSNDHVNNAVLSLRSIKCFVKNIKISLRTTWKFTGVESIASLILNIIARFKLVISRKLRLLDLLTYSMLQSPSSEANCFAASQEILRILWNPKVHYRTHKLPPPVPVPSQPNPVHIPTSYFLEIHPNIIHPTTPRSPQWSLSFRFPHQDPIRPPLLTHTRHMPSPSHGSLSPRHGASSGCG